MFGQFLFHLQQMSRYIADLPVLTLLGDAQGTSKEFLTQQSSLLCTSIKFDERRNVHVLKLH